MVLSTVTYSSLIRKFNLEHVFVMFGFNKFFMSIVPVLLETIHKI